MKTLSVRTACDLYSVVRYIKNQNFKQPDQDKNNNFPEADRNRQDIDTVSHPSK